MYISRTQQSNAIINILSSLNTEPCINREERPLRSTKLTYDVFQVEEEKNRNRKLQYIKKKAKEYGLQLVEAPST